MGSGFPDRRAGHSSGNSAPPASRLSLLVIRPARPTLVEVPLADPSFAMVSFRAVRKVGATRFELATSASRKCRSFQAKKQSRFVKSSMKRVPQSPSVLFA